MPDFSTIGLRPSLGPVAKQCPSAMFVDAKRPEIRTVAKDAFANLGTALHAVFKDRIYRGQHIHDDALVPYTEKYNVTIEGYYGIGWRARQVAEKWARLAQWYQDAETEKTISCTLKNGFKLTGTPDLFKVMGETALIFDLKTGEKDLNFIAQLELYALILWKNYGASGLKEVYVAQFSPLLEKYSNKQLSAGYLEWLEGWWCDWMAMAGVKYIMGPMCQICPRMMTCQAVIRSIDPLAAELRLDREVSPYDIARFRPSIKVMENMVARFKEVEKALLERHGIIDLGDGYELYFKEEFRDLLNPVQAWYLLTGEHGIPQDKLLEQMKISKEAVKEAARAVSVPRDKERGLGIMQKKIFASLSENGAMAKVPHREVAMRPTPPKQVQ